jgi:hypothetical protein
MGGTGRDHRRGRQVISDAQLRALTPGQRAHLARRLAALDAAGTGAGAGTGTGTGAAGRRSRWSRRRLLAVLAFGACLAMIPWTVALANDLPDRYVTLHWSTTWVGFDSLLMLSFAVTGLATWRHHRARWAAALVTATLLACDAWFDVSTASTVPDMIGSAVTAAAGELPLAALLVFLAYRGREAASGAERVPA